MKLWQANPEVTGGLLGLLVNYVYQLLKMVPHHDLWGLFFSKPFYTDITLRKYQKSSINCD